MTERSDWRILAAIRRLWRWYFRSVEVRERPENVVDVELEIRASEAERSLPRADRTARFYERFQVTQGGK